ISVLGTRRPSSCSRVNWRRAEQRNRRVPLACLSFGWLDTRRQIENIKKPSVTTTQGVRAGRKADFVRERSGGRVCFRLVGRSLLGCNIHGKPQRRTQKASIFHMDEELDH